MRMTVQEIVKACGGRLLCGDPETEVTSVVTDSRDVASGSLFVPIRGEKADAHAFIRAAFASGAAASLTEEHAEMQESHAWIAVESTLGALQRLASAYRSRFSVPVVGITGSVGKTTTKEMVALALSAGLNVMKTRGNHNSQIGLPLTLFGLEAEHQAAVVEMGMSDFGEMGRLAQIARPDFAVMTNIGISHIRQLGTRENILKEKLHITDCFHAGSVLFLNGNDDMLASLRSFLPFETVYYGTQAWCGFRAEDIAVQGETTRFRYTAPDGETGEAVLPVLGEHHVLNALAGLAVARRLGVPLKQAAAALGGYQPLAMRQQIYHVNEITIIDDSYNSSPDAAKSSLNVLSGLGGGRRVAVLADMLELGDYSRKAHFGVGEYAAHCGIDLLVTVGEEAKAVAEGARSVQPELDCRVCTDNRQAVQVLREYLTAGDAVLIKGSRGMHTDEIVRELL